MFITCIYKLPLLLQSPTEISNEDKDQESGFAPQLSISLKYTGLPIEVYQGIWIKAAKLVANKDSITNAPAWIEM